MKKIRAGFFCSTVKQPPAGTATIKTASATTGKWNTAGIIQQNGHLTFYFNGVKTLDIQQGTGEWKRLIENSKFKTWKDFATTPKGKIAFQDHGHEVAFRNIRIRRL